MDEVCFQPVEPDTECQPFLGFNVSRERLDELVALGHMIKQGDVYYVIPYHDEHLDKRAPWGPTKPVKIESFSG